jgi:hypothetical protein
MAHFDNYMAGEIFGNKIKSIDILRSDFVTSQNMNSKAFTTLMCMNLILKRAK